MFAYFNNIVLLDVTNADGKLEHAITRRYVNYCDEILHMTAVAISVGYPTNQELEEVAKDLVGKLKQNWVLLQSYLNVPDHIMAEIDSDPSILRKVFKMLKMWRDHSEDSSKDRLAVCLKAVTYKSLNRIANKLVSGEYNFLTPSNSSRSSTSVDSYSTSGSTSSKHLRREVEDTPLPKKRPRTDE